MVLVSALLMVFWVGIMGSATMLLNSLTNEKANRVIEILMVSSQPAELLVGKIINEGILPLFLSLFPFTSPTAMMMRLALGPVPPWQLAFSIILLVGTMVVILRAVARMFRAQNIMSGQPFSLKRLVFALLEKNPL